MASLFTYMRQCQRFLHDTDMKLLDPGDLQDYINIARREVAMRSQCLRVLTGVSGAVTTVTVTNPGHGYTAPVATINPPDLPSGFLPFPNGAQAIAVAVPIAGQIASIDVQYGGSGYSQPTVTITDPTGTGATATVQTSLTNTLNVGQEQYPFSLANLTPFPGVGSIYYVRSVSVLYSNYRYSLPTYSFSVYQSMIRQYAGSSQYQYVPTFAAQFGQGTGGTLFLYPPPSQLYPMEWDCQCLPADLIADASPEALPDPWTDAVPYWAAHLAFLNLQNANAARMYLDLYNDRMTRFGAYTRPGKISNPYGRW